MDCNPEQWLLGHDLQESKHGPQRVLFELAWKRDQDSALVGGNSIYAQVE